GERMDWIVQKAAELGVTRIIPVTTQYGVVRLDGAQSVKKADHWRAIAIAACEQCGRNRIPAIEPPITLGGWLTLNAATNDAGEKVLLDPNASASLLRSSGGSRLTLLVGPEGGLTALEMRAALAHGFTAARLGPRILRTETAALTALSILQA